MNQMRRQKRAGFATLEVVCALGIFAVMGFGSFQMYFFGIDRLKVSGERTIAVRALENEYERLRAVPMAELRELNDTQFILEMPELARLDRTKTAVSVEPFESRGDVQQVTLTVSWFSRGGRVITEELTGLRAY